ncbi:MAG TPA: hypothetical protein PKE38_16840, partial [Ignavibacteriaceae bacterium]|nr:hypothetical protein [Ignavibacteriaceae bacterium]
DKTLSWDGSIFVYSDKSWKNENFVGRIPVQIKSNIVEVFNINNSSHYFKVADLRNYFNDGGVFLFLVQIKKNNRKIFFRNLACSDLKKILTSLRNKTQKRVKIELFELDTCKLVELEDESRNFLLHRKKQVSNIDYPMSIEQATELTTTFITSNPNFESYLLSHDLPLYGKRLDSPAEFFITNIRVREIINYHQVPVSINSKIYYSSYESVITQNGSTIRVGHEIFLNQGNIQYKSKCFVIDELVDVDFLLNLIIEKAVTFGDKTIFIETNPLEKEIIDSLRERKKLLDDIKALHDLFNLSLNKLNLDNLDEGELRNLSLLIYIFIYNHRFYNLPFNKGFNSIKISDNYFGILALNSNENGPYTVFNIARPISEIQCRIDPGDGNFHSISPYVFISADFLCNIKNLDFDLIIEDIEKHPLTSITSDLIIRFGLELIKTYDCTKEETFLASALEIYKWLQLKNECVEINKINEYQILRRRRTFTQEEKRQLLFLRDNEAGNNGVLCAINILLENKTEAEIYFESLVAKEKEDFYNYPIYTLGKNLGIFL